MISDVLFTLSRLKWNSFVDIFLVSIIFYWLLTLVQGTRAVQLLRGIFILVVGAIAITSIFDLTAVRWLISNSLPALLVAIPVIFQPEIRRALERLGRTGNLLLLSSRSDELEATLKTVASAAHKLSQKKHGAIIVLERETGLEDYIETGIRLDAMVTEDLLLTIFYINTALHDGAVIVRHNRIKAASCLLPLSRAETSESHLGTRHRASLGLSEGSDAVVVVVSEETGIISIAHNGKLIRKLEPDRLFRLLKAFYRSQLTQAPSMWVQLKKRLVWPLSNK